MLSGYLAQPQRDLDNWRRVTAQERCSPLPHYLERDHQQEPNERKQERSRDHNVQGKRIRAGRLQRQTEAKLGREV